ncbi:hypothetical protein B0919_15605 [Hymenobacter sp. CRA2]|nr:hypothetical protein B0919_15605 [Hymenobacter sp. CRA2]
MGYEYKVICTIGDEEAKQVLESVAYFSRLDGTGFHEYRKPTNPGTMPDARSSREPYGFYFCDNGGAHDILDSLMAYCLKHVPITVEDRE